MFIGHIFTILAFVKMRKEITAEDRAKAKETKILAEEERKKEKEDERCRNLLSETGKLFFIKYYEQLKNWNPTDIFDIIEENYSEEIKRKRISFAKEIFKQNLEVRALEEIADSTQNVVDEETIHKAQEILNRKIQ